MEKSRAKKSGSFLKQAAILAIASLLVRVIGFLYRLPLTNLIGDVGNAIYSAGYYIYTFLLILSSAGLPAAIAKMVSERIAVKEYRNAHAVFQVSFIISGFLGFICMIAMLLFAEPIANLAHSPDSYYAILTLAPTLFIVAIMSVYRGYFQGMNTMIPTAISQIIEQVFNAFFSVYLAYLLIGFGVPEGEKNYALGAAGGTAGTGIGALAGLIIVFFSYMMVRPYLYKQMRREGRRQSESSRKIAKILLCTALPIIAGTAVFSITNLIDMKMVMSRLTDSNAFTEQQVKELYGQLSGKYVPLTTLPVSITTALATAVVPSIAASVRLGDKENVRRKMGMALRVGMIISIPAAVGIGVLGDQITRMLYPSYPGGGNLLTVGAISIIFLALCQIVTGILQGIGYVSIPVVGAVLGAIVKVLLNYILIVNPKINVLGAVISTTGCYMVASIYNVCMLSKVTRVKLDFMGSIVKPTVASILMGICCYSFYNLIHMVIESNTVSTLVSISLSVGIYGVLLLLMKGIRQEDIMMLPGGAKIAKILRRRHLI